MYSPAITGTSCWVRVPELNMNESRTYPKKYGAVPAFVIEDPVRILADAKQGVGRIVYSGRFKTTQIWLRSGIVA